MTESASAKLSFVQQNATTYQYSMTLTDTGTTTAGTFWFAWIPGQDYLLTSPLTISDPAGWTHIVTGGFAGDGFAIQWKATVASGDIQPGGSLSGFTFTTTDTPAYVSGNAKFQPTTPVLTGFIYSGAPFSDPGAQFVVACFATGTRIVTSAGEIPVEGLAVGDRVPTLLGGGLATITWLGHRRVDCARHGRPEDVWPVRVRAGAFAPGLPLRDLLLSPDHAVYCAGALMPIRYLVNGASIAQEPVDHVTYWHVELERHDVLLAEGMPVESFLDTGNRSAFANGGAVAMAEPDFALRVWQADACAELVTTGPRLAAAKARLLRRAAALGCVQTGNPDLHLLADGVVVWPEIDGDVHRFHLAQPATELRLVSRRMVPAAMLPEQADCRRVGCAVTFVAVDGEAIPAGDARRGAGWHAAEPKWQWTDGDATLDCPAATCVEVVLQPLASYWLDFEFPAPPRQAADFLDFAAPHTYIPVARLDVVMSAATPL